MPVAWPFLYRRCRSMGLMEKNYHFGGLDLSVRMPEAHIYLDEGDLAPFAAKYAPEGHHFFFELVDALQPPEGELLALLPNIRVYRSGDGQIRYHGAVKDAWEKAYARGEHRGRLHRVQLKKSRFPGRVEARVVLNCLCAEHLLAQSGSAILHSAFISWENQGILFTAPSGTGKSTQAALWERFQGARILNGDRAVIRFEQGQPLAGGLPFAGSSGICQSRELPLAAVVCLSQASSTTIRRLSGFEAFRFLWEGCCVNVWDRESVDRISETVERICRTVPVFHLACTPDLSAVTALEQALKE